MISSLPYLICWIWSLFIAWIADKLISSKKLSRAYVRKGTTVFAFIGAAAGLFGITFIGCNPTWAIILLCFAIAIEGTGYSGYMVNQLELSPNYAGTLKGTSSTFANICGFVSPALTGALTNRKVSNLYHFLSQNNLINIITANNRSLEQCILHICWFLCSWSLNFCYLWQNLSSALEYLLGKGKENGN